MPSKTKMLLDGLALARCHKDLPPLSIDSFTPDENPSLLLSRIDRISL